MGSKWPSRTECWGRLRAAAPPAWVLDHVAAVEGLAAAMAERALEQGTAVDVELVHAGAILHDVGRSITQDPTHAYRGAEELRREGWPREVCDIVERHTGAGLTAEDAAELGLPHALIPQGIEEKIVAHADNLYSGTRRLTLVDLEAKYAAKKLPDAYARIADLHQELQGVLGVDPAALEPVQLPAA